MKKTLIFLLFLVSEAAYCQWCVPSSAIPYNSNMPGITHVALNTIDRTSADLENYPHNNYVNTGMSTILTPGETYSFSISFTIDPSICPDMNIRVWIDYNQDYQLDDSGETVINANNRLPSTYDASFTVPLNVLPGNTRMRVTAKMSPNGGHTIPTPCDDPPDPFGYHGEIEDYDITISSPNGINNVRPKTVFQISQINDDMKFSFATNNFSTASIELLDIQGKHVKEILREQNISPGEYNIEMNLQEVNIPEGIYLAVYICNNEKKVFRIVVL
jgi:hypothetical protein